MLGGAGQKPGAHGVPREHRGIDADALGIGFHDIRDRLRRQALAYRAAFPDRLLAEEAMRLRYSFFAVANGIVVETLGLELVPVGSCN